MGQLIVGSCTGHFSPSPDTAVLIVMARHLLLAMFVAVLFVGAFAPFPRSDPRAVFNPVIEPWWCRMPRMVRELLHLGVTFSELPEGPCKTVSGNFEPPFRR